MNGKPVPLPVWAKIALWGAAVVVTLLFVWVYWSVRWSLWPRQVAVQLEFALRQLEIADHAVIGLLSILGVIIVCIALAATGARLRGSVGPVNVDAQAGSNVQVGASAQPEADAP